MRIFNTSLNRWGVLATLAGVVAALVALTVATSTMRERARHDDCAQNLSFIGLGLVSYRNRLVSYPPAALPNDALPPEKRPSWVIEVLPDMVCLHCWGLDDFVEIDPSGPQDVDALSRLAVLPLAPLLCPSSPFRPVSGTYPSDHSVDRSRLSEPVPLTYVGITGLGRDAASFPLKDQRAGVFGFGRTTRPQDITDGMSTTLMVVETSDLRGVWVAGGEATVRGLDPETRPYLGKGRPFGGNHAGKTMVLFADGSVRDIRDSIAPATVEALSTIAGGEHLPPGWKEQWVVKP